MLSRNLTYLRKHHGMTQEEVAERLEVSRQTIAKWETGKSVPDVNNSVALAELFGVSVEDLVKHSEEETGIVILPKGKHFFGSVTVGENGQITIPGKARKVFGLESGDQVFVFGEDEKGISLITEQTLLEWMSVVGVDLSQVGKNRGQKGKSEGTDG